MNSVALPTSVARPRTLEAEGDLVHAAARADSPAVEELYRRHGQMAWRLAVAVSTDAVSAADAVAEGFTRALRSARRHRGADESFRIQVLVGVYRGALGQVRHTAVPSASVPSGGDADILVACFASLPERWRGALWLGEAEGLDANRIGAVLGVAAPVANQLAERGRRGLANRLTQAGVAVPAGLAAALRPLAPPVPTGLGQAVTERWRRAVTLDPATKLAPITWWLGDRAERSLAIAAGGLLAFGVIGVGVLNQGIGVKAVQSQGAGGPATAVNQPLSASPVSSFALPSVISRNFLTNFGLLGTLPVPSIGPGNPETVAQVPIPSLAVPSALGSFSLAPGALSATPATGATPRSPSGSSSGGTGAVATSSVGSSTGSGSATPSLAVPGVAGLTTTKPTTTLTVLPSTSGGVLGVGICPSGLGAELLGNSIISGCPTVASPTSGSVDTSSSGTAGTTSGTGLISPVVNLVNGVTGLL